MNQHPSMTPASPALQSDPSPSSSPGSITQRPRVCGKFLQVGNDKLWVRGVTYGTFRPDAQGQPVPSPEQVRADFMAMSQHGINAVRTYTTPPRWLLDIAGELGLWVMVGLSWEQHVAFLDDSGLRRSIEANVRDSTRALSGHPALLAYTIANEIPASIVRWYGRRRIERFLHRLYEIVKREDPSALVTYVNYPTTEYLRLPFLDLVSFNVYLESHQELDAYLARLQNQCGDRPLLMAEIGLDSRRNGELRQSTTLDWQIRAAFEAGCCGTFVFSWTDEWHRGGYDIEDWDFGITTRDRKPKLALEAVHRAYTSVPFELARWPRISVVVCSYNGAATIRDTMEGLQRINYPDFEVIVVNDGSTDRTAEIVSEYPVRLISTENRGLSNARNTGWEEATGEIVAYTDDDAWPDPHWLKYLALEYSRGDFVGVGGPNLPPAGDGAIAECVANAPGGPVHVLLSDRVAEHIPGCNMSFRRSALSEIGGFDPVFRAAGDDVDVCWRLQDRGGVIAFAPAAVVWHHRRNSVRTYWKQQLGYGKAEALLERKWRQRYNASGHVAWHGRLYGQGVTLSLAALRWRVYGGIWGSALFQSLYERTPGPWLQWPLMPEWWLLVGMLSGLVLLGLSWSPLAMAWPLLALAVALPVVQAIVSASRARLQSAQRLRAGCLTAFLHLMQPFARLKGRIQHGLTPWRRRGPTQRLWRLRATRSNWRETSEPYDVVLANLENSLEELGAVVQRGGSFDGWDLEVRGGILGGAQLQIALEEHGGGKQMERFRIRPRASRIAGLATAAFGSLAALAYADSALFAASVLIAVATSIVVVGAQEAARAMAAFDQAVWREKHRTMERGRT